MKSPNDTFAVLAPNLVVSGNLVSEGNIHIDGTVEGDVQTVHLTIGATGVVKGRVFGREVKISGRVVGSITACELVLEESAIIEGDIHYQSLSVARGARMNGNSKFSETEPDITVLSGKKSSAKAENALAFGDAGDPPAETKQASRTKTASPAQ
ncbi:MAG: polymer-forming cytoskeletal protein [Pseudomonadota bacterium]|nr:polymer-forming cytoskeletal protein [Pseudomonadota bacterium]